MTTSRILFLDDSGKPSPNDGTSTMVIGGFSIPSEHVPAFSRRVAGAKSRFFSQRGDPGKWELKSTVIVRTKSLRRSKNRRFLQELIQILTDTNCTVYSASIDKSRMYHQMSLRTTMPLQVQALLEHFDAECRASSDTGLVISDWSSHHLDAHASQCVATYSISRRLQVHPTLYFANSSSSHAIQAADLVAGIRRRHLEGDASLAAFAEALGRIRSLSAREAEWTHKGRRFKNEIHVF